MSEAIKRHTILVVDDIADNIAVLQGILADDYQVKAARSGKAALEIAKTSPPDLILLDVMMPDMDGYEVCRLLKADPTTKSIPVIFVTTMDEVDDETLGFELGCVDYITKPVSPPVVIARVHAQVTLYNNERTLGQQVEKRTLEIRRLNSEVEGTQREVIFTLGAIAETRSKETGNHVRRVAEYSYAFARRIGLSEDEANLLRMASPMHDIGKVAIPDHILNKPGRLSVEEFEHMKKHVMLGYDMLKHSSRPLLRAAATVALTHHEKWDGTGYPEALAGEAIHIYGRITAIADVFDALGSERCYKKAWDDDRIFTLLRAEKGKHFDPQLVDIFFMYIDDFFAIRARFKDDIEG